MRVCACARVRVCACARVRVCACARVRVCACARVRVCAKSKRRARSAAIASAVPGRRQSQAPCQVGGNRKRRANNCFSSLLTIAESAKTRQMLQDARSAARWYDCLVYATSCDIAAVRLSDRYARNIRAASVVGLVEGLLFYLTNGGIVGNLPVRQLNTHQMLRTRITYGTCKGIARQTAVKAFTFGRITSAG